MKLSRRGKRTKRTKRTKCTKRTKNIKFRRNTKKQFRQYRCKNTYRKHSHKLRKNKRVMRGGGVPVPIRDLLDTNETVNLRYKKGDSFFSDTGEFKLSNENFSNEEPKQGYCFDKEYSITFTLTRQKDVKDFTISFKVLYTGIIGNKQIATIQRKLIISTLKPTNQTEYEKFCTVTKISPKTNKLNISTGERQFSSDLKLNDGEGNVYTFPVSSTRNKGFFENLVIHISKKFDDCESEPVKQKEYRPYDVENIKEPREVVGAYFGDQDPKYKE